MERRKIRDEEGARACMMAVKASGLSPAAWCRSEGVDGRSLRAWTINLQRGASRARKPVRSVRPVSLIELVPPGPALPAARYVFASGPTASRWTTTSR
ncbi:MAG TPA: hypothetical protein VG963_01090, partial [Polyangiaceae bacterium]|nr:hypothetical protein [Polyangiaceae bacterium]